jgi:uncharacterized protein (TIGR02996 family)
MKISMNSKRAQETKLAFQAAILGGDEVAGLAYADWLEEMGSTTEARKIRAKIREADLARYIRCEVIGKVDRLVASQTAFDGWFGPWREEQVGYVRGMRDAMANGYVPTLSRGRALQARLGRYLEAIGRRVFWIS